MDVFSHFALPFLAVWLATRRRDLAFAAGIGGVAPDADSVTAILAVVVEPLYWLGHRGVSHSLLGAPLYALGLCLALRARFWSRVLEPAAELRFGPRLVAIAMLASYTHVALDWLTFWGVPLLWPWTPARWTAGVYFYGVTAMMPFAAWLAWRLARGRETERLLRGTALALGLILVVAGGVRVATEPEGHDHAFPESAEWSWNTLDRTGEGWNATFWSMGRVAGNATYVERAPVDPAGERALELARGHVEYRAFALYAIGPEMVQVEPREDGGHNVTFYDLAERAQADRAPWFPFADEAGITRLGVSPDGRVSVIED